ncbi:fumarylacetoacetate hydrolase family protein [Pelagicoccus sp. SDUM812005]|uniref:fumarylacetoacetate hydrolase family protein n=1 Tax=Pelagicoccus sp. SDUM812005 TaxID=3041257 RepID=UPI00280EDACE|nr:fumarylacetoacetate hydrolase family protein [Pelagicoccus sp. SDUM812005]MDQ8180219.1 fumarylacetoacetate hydrolase family protein [Pelagicoccus sp. SDUM812005]
MPELHWKGDGLAVCWFAMKAVNFSGVERFPSKLLCVGRNYVEHIEELGNAIPEQMVLFFKPNASIGSVLRAEDGEALHYEGEICFGVEEGQFRYVGFGLDLTKRELQGRLRAEGLPWERSKAFRGAGLFSAFVPFEGAMEDLSLQLWIDGVLAQEGGVKQMINKPQEILDELLAVTDLEDFDIVMTGTPAGVGRVSAGSRFEGVVLCSGKELVRCSWEAQGAD